MGNFVYEGKDQDGTSASSPLSLRNAGNSDFPDVTAATLFDLASLTKPIATTTMAMLLYERGLLELEAPIAGILPELISKKDPRRANITFRMLLAHSSGLPAYEKLFLKARSRGALLDAAFSTPLTADPGTGTEYSDIGFILLGTALERVAQEPLDAFCQREIFGPLRMLHTTFNPAPGIRRNIPPTADEREDPRGADAPVREMPPAEPGPTRSPQKPRSTFRNRIIQGEVQDENASVLGGVAGHAGLFSTAEDVARFAHFMFQCGAGAPAREMPKSNATLSESQQKLVSTETIALFTRREESPAGTTRTLGWDTPSNPSQSGKHFGPYSFGHLGYTGTSLWIDPDRQLSITLLTNRTWPDCSNQAIKQVRPKFHDAVIEALDR